MPKYPVLSFCYQIEPWCLSNALFMRVLRFFSLFKLVSQEFYSDNFNSAFAIFCRYIRHIRRHIFYCHKNCIQNVLMHQANNLFWYTKVISRYCIRSWILLSTSQILPRTFYYTFCTNISFETAALYVLKVYILL